MSRFWRGISDEKLIEAEKELFRFSGLEEDEYSSYPVEFKFSNSEWKEELDDSLEDGNIESTGWFCFGSKAVEVQIPEESIWTLEMGKQNKTNLVMIHGYGGSGMVFYKMFKRLSEKFHVYCIDLLGMGRSSRNEFNCETFKECEQYFVNSIEKWRKAMNLDKINLLGHSFGGFIASRYALHYPENLGKLIFLSPFASEITCDKHIEQFEEQMNNSNWFTRQITNYVIWMFRKNTSPFGLARKAGRLLGGYAIKRGIQRRLVNVPEAEFLAFYEYLHQIIMSDGSSEYAFNIMFPNFMITDKAIMNNLDEYKENGIGKDYAIIVIEYCFLYGSKDWLDTNLNGDFVSTQLEKSNEKVHIIDRAGHHVSISFINVSYNLQI